MQPGGRHLSYVLHHTHTGGGKPRSRRNRRQRNRQRRRRRPPALQNGATGGSSRAAACRRPRHCLHGGRAARQAGGRAARVGARRARPPAAPRLRSVGAGEALLSAEGASEALGVGSLLHSVGALPSGLTVVLWKRRTPCACAALESGPFFLRLYYLLAAAAKCDRYRR